MKFRILTASVLLCVSAAYAGAQPLDYGFVKDTNPQFTSTNAAGLARFSGERVSFAELDFDKDNGGLVGIEGSDDSWRTELKSESFVRISDRMAFWGRLSYSYFKGRNMGGQMLMDPVYNPVNFLESTDTTTGIKNREMYGLGGGLAYSLSERLALGFKVNYSSGDMVKVKDPRYRSEWMDIDLSAGLSLTPSEGFSVGVSGLYRNTIEQLKAHIYGSTDRQYYAYTDKGGFWGSKPEMIEGDYNYVPASSFRPMYNGFYGAAIQVEAGQRVRVFNELKYLRRDGYYGKKASSSPLFFEFSGNVFEYDGNLVIKGGDKLRKIHLDASMLLLDNNENTLRYTTVPGKSTVVEYLGQNKLMSRTDIEGNLSYDAYLGTSGVRPSFQYGASVYAFLRNQTATVYPSFRKHSYMKAVADAYALKNIFTHGGMFTLKVDASFQTGGGNPAEDGTYVPGSAAKMYGMDTYMNRQFEYETASRVGGSLSFAYTHFFSKGIAAYLRICDSYLSLLSDPQYLASRSRNSAVVAIGCNF